jgi:hypothetical protein
VLRNLKHLVTRFSTTLDFHRRLIVSRTVMYSAIQHCCNLANYDLPLLLCSAYSGNVNECDLLVHFRVDLPCSSAGSAE